MAKHNPSTSHCVFVIFFNSVFITTGFSSVSSSTNIIIPFLKAIIRCFFLGPSPSFLSSLFFPHHDIFAISKFFILSKRVISPICFPELAKTKIFSFFFEIKILSSFGEYSINLVSSSKLLNQVFFPSTVPEYIWPSSYKNEISLPLLLHLTSTIRDTPRLFTIWELYKSFSVLFHTTKELLSSTVTILSKVGFHISLFMGILWKAKTWKVVRLWCTKESSLDWGTESDLASILFMSIISR